MPIVSGGGGGGPAAGSYLPVAAATGVTVDTTTYDNPISGSGKLTTLVFPAGDTAALAIAKTGDAFPRLILGSNSADGLVIGNGNIDAYAEGGQLRRLSTNGIELDTLGAGSVSIEALQAASQSSEPPQLGQLSPYQTITNGALPTFALVSGAATQNPVTRDIETITPVTFNPTAGVAATCVVAISPDNTTYSALATATEPAGVVFDGTIHLIKVRLPRGWYLKLTVTNATLGTTTYY